MGLTSRLIVLSLAAASAQAAAPTKKELVTAAGNAASSVGITPAQQAQMQAEAARLSGIATAELSNLSNNVKAISPGLQNGLTADQVGKISGQGQQALQGLMANPQAMEAAAKAGVSVQQLNSMQSATDAALRGVKAGEAKASELMNSEAGTKLKADAKQALTAVESDPELREQAAAAGQKVKAGAAKAEAAFNGMKDGDLDRAAAKYGATPEQQARLRRGEAQAVDSLGGGTGLETTLQGKAAAALVKFCKKYEGTENVPARCRKKAAAAPQR